VLGAQPKISGCAVLSEDPSRAIDDDEDLVADRVSRAVLNVCVLISHHAQV
jgi:hypothetical protein